MNRRPSLASAACALAHSAAPERRNIVFLMAGQLREDPTAAGLTGNQL